MSQGLFDTQFAVDDLRRAGFTDEQAKANVRFVRGALEARDRSGSRTAPNRFKLHQRSTSTIVEAKARARWWECAAHVAFWFAVLSWTAALLA